MITADRVRETTTTTGTGDITLAGAAAGFQAFSGAFADGDVVDYAIIGRGSGEYETGTGKFNSAGPTLTRTTVVTSSNANALTAFSAGTKDVVATVTKTNLNNTTRSLVNAVNGAVLTPGAAVQTLASYALPLRTLRTGDVLRVTSYVKQVAGTGTLAPRFQLTLGGTTPIGSSSVGAIADVGFFLEAWIYILGAASQYANGRMTRDANGASQFWAGASTVADITTALTLALKCTYNSANGTASLQALMFAAELVRA